MGGEVNCCAHCPKPSGPQRADGTARGPRVIGGPAVPIALGVGLLAVVVLIGMLVVPAIVAVILAVAVAGWLGVQLLGELALELELRREPLGGPAPALTPLPAIQAVPARPAIEPLRLPPLKFGAFVIDGEALNTNLPGR